MSTETLRFMVSRPPQLRGAHTSTRASVKLYPDGPSALQQQVLQAPDRKTGVNILRTWLGNAGNGLNANDPHTATVMAVEEAFRVAPRLAGQAMVAKIQEIAAKYLQGVWQNAAAVVAFKLVRTRVADRLFAQVLLGQPEAAEAGTSLRLIRAAELILTTIPQGNKGLPRVEVDRIMRIRPLLPKVGVGQPQPPAQDGGRPPSNGTSEESGSELGTLRAAGNDLKGLAKRMEKEHDETDLSSFEVKRVTGFFGSYKPAPETRLKTWQELADPKTLETLGKLITDLSKLSLNDAEMKVEQRRMELTSRRMADPRSMAASKRIGSRHVSAMPAVRRLGGEAPNLSNLDATPTVPSGIGDIGSCRRGELLIVRQDFLRYDLGEIAHIENVLKGESHKRVFSHSQTNESLFSRSNETSTLEERDQQSTQRFELSSAMKESASEKLNLEAGVSVTASYGPTIGVEANSQFGYDHSQEKSNEAASSFAKEVSSLARSKIETHVSERRTTRNLTEVREMTRHSVDNTVGVGHVRGIYRWVDKVYKMQVVNYGLRDLYEMHVPEPGALLRHFNGLKEQDPLDIPEPTAPVVEDGNNGYRALTPEDIDEINYAQFVSITNAKDVTAPPDYVITISAAVQCKVEGDSDVGTTVNSELVVPEGYVSTSLKFNGAGHKKNTDDYQWRLEISGRNFQGRNSGGGTNDRGEELGFGGRVGKVPFGVYHEGYDNLLVTLWMNCIRTEAAFTTWQLNTFKAIMEGYQLQRSEYDERKQAQRNSFVPTFSGKAPAANLEMIRNELKRAAISIMTAQRFEKFDSMRQSGSPDSNPEIAFPDAKAEGRYVAFMEQAFEWENMTYVLYPYFWGRKHGWRITSQQDDVDHRLAQFLRAGFARVQVPVRPGSEGLVAFTFSRANWSGDTWNHPTDPPGFERDGEMTIEDELRAQTGGADFVQGLGHIKLVAGSLDVVGTETEFTEADENRELRVRNVTYRIVKVLGPLQVEVAGPAPTESVEKEPYSLGPTLVGLPWELKVPTTLVYLHENDDLKL